MQNNHVNQSEVDLLLTNRERAEKERLEKERQLKASVDLVFSKPEGVIIGKWLFEACSTGNSNNDINPNKLIYHKSRQDLYQSLRQYMTKENIVNIELGGFE